MHIELKTLGALAASSVAIAVLWTLPFGISTAHAEDDGATEDVDPLSYQLQRFRPAPGSADYMGVFAPGVEPHLDWSAGVYFNYADSPLELGTTSRPERDTFVYQSQIDAMATIGLFDIFELGVVVPWTMRQRHRDLGILEPDDGGDLRSSALNDVRLTSKFHIPGLDEAPVDLAVVTGMTVPTGNDEALTGDGGVGAEMLAVGEYVIGHTIRVAANVGFRYRSSTRVMRAYVLGNEITWGLAAQSPFVVDAVDILAEIDGAVSVQSPPDRLSELSGITRGEVPVEARLAARYGFHDDWSITGGLGAGLSDGVGTPDWRGFVGISGKWATGGWLSVDYDSPNFAAEMDPCDPHIREQQQGRLRFDPVDCPEVDDEDDGLDEEDIYAGLDDPDGDTDWEPPEPPPEDVDDHDEDEEGDAALRQGAIVITERITFETGSAELREESHSVLDDVATIIGRNDAIRLLRIEGHTDNVGSPNMNLELSEDRAKSVKDYLVDQGIGGYRLETVGFGEYEPIADNSTEQGRAENRRVEFHILEMD